MYFCALTCHVISLTVFRFLLPYFEPQKEMVSSIKDEVSFNSDGKATSGRGALFCRNSNFTVFNVVTYWRSQF